MFVPSYQMHNVLNVYSKQLRQNMTAGNNKKTPDTPSADQVNLAPGGRREATIEKVSKAIIDKITRSGTETAPGPTNKTTFVFNVIDAINKKITNTLSVEDSNFLIRRFEQLSKEAADKKTESWV
jgi:hypothetical protein